MDLAKSGEYLTTVEIDGERWIVRLVSISDTDEIEWCEGKTLFNEGVILIKNTIVPERRFAVLLHEMDHVLSWNHGMAHMLSEQFGRERAEQLEETWLQTTTPARRASLQHNGWLKPPLLLTARET